jgi:hypothetical protein
LRRVGRWCFEKDDRELSALEG